MTDNPDRVRKVLDAPNNLYSNNGVERALCSLREELQRLNTNLEDDS